MMIMTTMTICQFQWWRKPEDPEESTDIQKATDKLSHIRPVLSVSTEAGPQRCETR